MLPAINDESITTIFDCSIYSASSKASNVIKIDMVNPMPPRNPAPITFRNSMGARSLAAFSQTDKYENKVMPRGFPIMSPAKIP